MLTVRILKTDKRLGIKVDEVYNARRYSPDPSKVTLLSRKPDGYDPECNQYVTEVAHWMQGEWKVVEGNTYVTEV